MHILSTIRPTKHQMKVLAIIAANKDHPTKAADEISYGTNIVAARNMLMKLNLITYSDNGATLTDKGQQVASAHDIIDDTGELTPTGQRLISQDQVSTSNNTPPQEEPLQTGELGIPPTGMGNELAPPGMEGYSPLFKSLLLKS